MQLRPRICLLTAALLLTSQLAMAESRSSTEISQDMLSHSDAAQAASAAAVEAYRAGDQAAMCRNLTTVVAETKLAADLALVYRDTVLAESRKLDEDGQAYNQGLQEIVTSLNDSHTMAEAKYQDVCT